MHAYANMHLNYISLNKRNGTLPWWHSRQWLKTCPKSINNSLNQRKTKRKLKTKLGLQMVKIDYFNLMTTLGISSNQFPNIAPQYFCICWKTISMWPMWCGPIMQRHYHLILINEQSGNVISKCRSSHLVILSKSFSFCKQMALVCVIYYGHLTQILVCKNLKINFMRPLCRTP